MTYKFNPGRRSSLHLITALGLGAVTGLGLNHKEVKAQTAAKEFRIGWQKGSNLAILKARGNLDKKLNEEGVNVRWVEFTAGPQMLEGLNVGSIDFACVGETPPVFAQAAGADLIYIANEPPASRAEKVLVPQNSAINSLAELKGKRIVLNRGSNVHYLLLKVLEKESLAYSDVNVVYLPPADARAAFENGSVDAWIIWDPFAEAAIAQTEARVLTTGEGLVENYNLYLSTQSYAKNYPEVLKWTLDEIKTTGDWTLAHFDEAADILAPQLGLNREITRKALQNYGYGVKLLDEKVIDNQQAIADAFTNLKLISRKLEVRHVVWRP